MANTGCAIADAPAYLRVHAEQRHSHCDDNGERNDKNVETAVGRSRWIEPVERDPNQGESASKCPHSHSQQGIQKSAVSTQTGAHHHST